MFPACPSTHNFGQSFLAAGGDTWRPTPTERHSQSEFSLRFSHRKFSPEVLGPYRLICIVRQPLRRVPTAVHRSRRMKMVRRFARRNKNDQRVHDPIDGWFITASFAFRRSRRHRRHSRQLILRIFVGRSSCDTTVSPPPSLWSNPSNSPWRAIHPSGESNTSRAETRRFAAEKSYA